MLSGLHHQAPPSVLLFCGTPEGAKCVVNNALNYNAHLVKRVVDMLIPNQDLVEKNNLIS